MAEIIKKVAIKQKNGDLRRMCDRQGTTIRKVAKATGITEDMLRKFDKGERTLSWTKWEIILNELSK